MEALSETFSQPSLGAQILFWIMAVSTLFGAVMAMTRRNPVAAVMSLVWTFFSLAVLYVSLWAHFLAILQVLVYAGAIMVLFIFVVMILNREEVTPISWKGIVTRLLGIAGGVYLGVIFVILVANTPGLSNPLAPPELGFGTVAAVGDVLFKPFVFPFEAISLLLIVAIVGSVVVSRSARQEELAAEAAARLKAIQTLGQDAQGLLGEEDDDHHGHGGHGGH